MSKKYSYSEIIYSALALSSNVLHVIYVKHKFFFLFRKYSILKLKVEMSNCIDLLLILNCSVSSGNRFDCAIFLLLSILLVLVSLDRK